MKLGRSEKLVLYALGSFYENVNHKFEAPLEVSLSKNVFIEILKKTNLAETQERALYKNLESLEGKKLVMYLNKNLVFTPKGNSEFVKVKKEVEPFFHAREVMVSDAAVSATKKIQTHFK